MAWGESVGSGFISSLFKGKKRDGWIERQGQGTWGGGKSISWPSVAFSGMSCSKFPFSSFHIKEWFTALQSQLKENLRHITEQSRGQLTFLWQKQKFQTYYNHHGDVVIVLNENENIKQSLNEQLCAPSNTF